MEEREQKRRERDEYEQKMKELELQNDEPKRTRSGRISRPPQNASQQCRVADQATLNMIRVSLGTSSKGNLCLEAHCHSNNNIHDLLLEIGFCPAGFALDHNTTARMPLKMAKTLRELGLTVPDIPQNLKPKKNPNNLTVMSLNGSKKKRSKK